MQKYSGVCLTIVFQKHRILGDRHVSQAEWVNGAIWWWLPLWLWRSCINQECPVRVRKTLTGRGDHMIADLMLMHSTFI